MKKIMVFRLDVPHEVCVDDDAYEKVKDKALWISKNGYVCFSEGTRITRKNHYLHRFITGCEKGMTVDHFDQNKLNNCKHNLRIVSFKDNQLFKKMKNRSSHYGGVSITAKGKWLAQGTLRNGKNNNMGYYKTEIEAAIYRDIKIITDFGMSAKTNLLPPMPLGTKIEVFSK